jgi:hypothetical protein
MVGEIITKIDNPSEKIQSEMISSFYNTLSRLAIEELPPTLAEKTTDFLVEDIKMSIEETPKETHIKKDDQEATVVNLPPLHLDDVSPIHFDFLLEEAANDLSLPVELIEEFVLDFIAQAREETPKMLLAYQEGNIKIVQNIGHLLKGASSNLRITPLADTLYEIQFCEKPETLAALIKEYWGHFLSFEKQINLTSK